jgi:hypothetical protein
VLTWDHKGKVDTKYVGPHTKGTWVKRNVWVPKVLVTNAQDPNLLWYLKHKHNLFCRHTPPVEPNG